MQGMFHNIYGAASMILFTIGFLMLFLDQNLVKKMIGFNIMDSAVFLFLTAKGYIFGKAAPMVSPDAVDAGLYINPIPTGLVLTGIVVSLSVTAFALTIIVRIYKIYGTVRMDELKGLVKRGEQPDAEVRDADNI